MIVAILTAGGLGTRMNNNIPKQFLTVDDIPIIVYTLRRFQENKKVDAIAIACLKSWQPVLKAYKEEHKISKLKWIVDGGSTGAESIMNCLSELESVCSENDTIIIHDGNRPLVDDIIIYDALRVYSLKGNAVACAPINEVLVVARDGDESSKESLDRDTIKRTQTPHVFQYGQLVDIYNKIKLKGLTPVAACDAAIILGMPIFLSKGSNTNFKITAADDLALFKAIIHDRSRS